MLYIVSGHMRSGTSMMMDCLSAGGRPSGLRTEWSRERDAAMNAKTGDGDYQANESYREVPLQEYGGFEFPRQYNESLIKVMCWGLGQMRRIPHHVVFMLRDPDEIAESYERMSGEPMTESVNGMRVPVLELEDHCGAKWCDIYLRKMKQIIVQHETRNDCHSLTTVRYREALDEPQRVFERLANYGWPIDAEIAAAQVNPERQRVCT